MVILNQLKKLQKAPAKKLLMKKWQQNKVLYFYYCVPEFTAYNFIVNFFALFFNELELSIECSDKWYPYWIFAKKLLDYISPFAKFKAKRRRNGSRKPKTYFINVS
jgi:hypothetical protein